MIRKRIVYSGHVQGVGFPLAGEENRRDVRCYRLGQK